MPSVKSGVVYQISNVVTGDTYVGSSSSGPFMRWASHITDLRMGRHNEMFQQLWGRYPRLQDWSFTILQSEIDVDELAKYEQEWFEKRNPSLNGTTSISKIVSKKRLIEVVRNRLREGVSYRDIAKECGCSLGCISNYKRKIENGIL